MTNSGEEAEALHPRFRIAINFPDLPLSDSNGFPNIMATATPDAIQDVLSAVAGSEAELNF